MPLLERKRLILAKLETTYGTDSVPTGAANAILTTGLTVTPMEGEDVSRELDIPYFGAQPTIPAGLHAKVAFKVELEPSGTAGTAPAWGVLLRGCAMAQTVTPGVSVTYNPITNTPHDALTIYVNMDGVNYVLTGARGTFKLTIAANKIPYLEFEFQGLWTAPADVAQPTPLYTAFRDPIVSNRVNTPVFTVNGVSTLRMKELSLDLGNALVNRFLIGGPDEVIIRDRAPMMEMLIEAEPMATLNPYTLARDQTKILVVLQHGVAAGRRATLNMRVQLMRPESPAADEGRVMFPLKGSVVPSVGNDEFTLALT